MRIADVSAFYTPGGGGVRTYVERKLAYAAQAGHELAVIVPGAADGIERRSATTRIVHVASPRLILDRRYRYFADAGAVHAALDAFAPDFVEASSPWRTAAIVADWRGAAPRALVMHADPLAAYPYRWLGGVMPRDAIDRGFDWFWAHLRRHTPAYALVVSANGGLTRRLTQGGIARAETVPLGVEAGIFSPAHRNRALRAELLRGCGLGETAFLLLGVGRFAPEKRWPAMIAAAARAGLRRPIGLVLAGEGRDRPKLERQIGMNPHIRLLPPIAGRAVMATLLASADALIHGCEAETFGLVVAEAVASGLPLVVPDEGGAADQAHPARAERFRAGDTNAAADAIVRLIDRDRARLIAAARDAAGQARTMDAHFAALFARYRACLTGAALAA